MVEPLLVEVDIFTKFKDEALLFLELRLQNFNLPLQLLDNFLVDGYLLIFDSELLFQILHRCLDLNLVVLDQLLVLKLLLLNLSQLRLVLKN